MAVSARVAFAFAALSVLSPISSQAAVTALRMTDLDLRDPHIFFDLLGCRDVTDVLLFGFSVNNEIQTNITTDGDADGNLDLSYLILFDPLDQGGAGGTLRFGTADCTAPMASTSCVPDGSPLTTAGYSNQGAGICLSPITGTTRPYTPAVTSSSAPCFVTGQTTIALDLGGIPITLRNAQIGATYVGNPAANLVNGLVRGFISETDANNTIIPASFPQVGGQPLSSLLPGGVGNCRSATASDKDVHESVVGWWFYFNFTAAQVPHPELVAVEPGTPTISQVRAYPNPFDPSLTIQYTVTVESDVYMSVHDAQGRWVSDLVHETRQPGRFAATWNGRRTSGERAAAGVYFIRIESRGQVQVERVVLLD